ncbi:MAG: hypothetical protein IPI64_11885 [Chloracidobacterium sp.]|nr:hypothetical protein [Chloracidobacterium sp.]
MVPSPSYFPTNLQERAAWYDNFAAAIQALGAALGLTVAELAQITADNAMMQFMAAIDVEVNDYAASVRSFRKVMTEGDVGDPTPLFPADVTPTVPAAVPTGIFERLDGFVKRIRVAPGYTPVIGAKLGITRRQDYIADQAADGTQQPTITATPQPGNVVNVKFVRGSSDGVFIETQLDNETAWTTAGRYPKSPAVINIAQNSDKLPRNVQIRARYLDGNDPVGDWSQIEVVQSIP